MRRLVLTMVSLLFVFGCSKGPREKAPVEIDVFSLSQITDAFSGPGNFRMYAKSPSNNLHFSTDMSRYSSTNTELEFGQWELNIIGWDTADYKGTTYCGRAFFNVPEDIVDGKLTITVTQAGCTDGYWSPLEFMTDGQFQKIKISFCESKFELNALTDWNSSCEADARSFKIGFIDYPKQPAGGAANFGAADIRYSSCVNIDDPTMPLSDMRLPLGNYGYSDIKYVINGYKDPGCNDASTEKIVLPVTQGLLSSAVYNNVRIFPGHDALGDPQREYLSINVNIAFIEQVGMRMSPTKVSLSDRPIPSVFSRTVTLYNESPDALMNCQLLQPSPADAGGKFSSPDFEANCNPKDADGLPLGIPNAGTCTFDLVADLNSVAPNVGIKSPIHIQCDGGRYIKTGEDGFLVCPGGNCTNGNFESDLRFRYIPRHFGDVVIGETPNGNNGNNEIEIRNNTEDQTFTGCQLSFSGPGVDAFSHGGIVSMQTPGGCLSNLGPMSDCRIQLAPIPTIIGDQEVSVVLSCNEDTVYYLENTSKVTGVYPLEYHGAPFYGKMNNAQDGYWTEVKFRNVSQASLSNCQISLSNNTDFEITDMFADGGTMSASETCGLPGNTRMSMFTNDECKIGLIPKAGATGIISTDINVYCNGNLVGSTAYSAERTSSALASIIVDQEDANFNSVEIPYYGDGDEQERWVVARNNTGGDLYGCHLEEASVSSPAASDALHIDRYDSFCHPKLKHGDSCRFKVVPSRFPWEGDGALQVGSHSKSARMVCDDLSNSSIATVSSTTATFNLTVTDSDAAMSLSPNFHNFGNVGMNQTVGPITIQVTNTSGALLTSCDPPEFYNNGNPTTAFTIANNTCPLDFPAGATCSFDLSYTDDGGMMEMSAEMELRCDNDKSVRTSSNFVANYSSGGGSNDIYGIYAFGFDNNSQFNEGQSANMYIYTYGSPIALSAGDPFFDGMMVTGNATFSYNPAITTDHRLGFTYTALANGTHNNDSSYSPTFYFNGASFINPDNGQNYANTYFNWEGGTGTRTMYVNQEIPPYVVSVTSQTPDGTYYTGDAILVDVNYSEPVSVQPTYNTYDESGQINCTTGTNVVNGGSFFYYNNIQVGDLVLVNGTDEYTVASKSDDDNMTFTTNCTTTYTGATYRLVGPGPEIVFENLNYQGHWHVTYDPAYDANPTDNIVTYRYVVRSDIMDGGFTLGSDGMLNRGVFSVANPTVQAANLTACYDLPDGSCIDKNTNFNFMSKPSITNIYHNWGGGDIQEGNTIRFQVMFDEAVQVATPANVKLHFKNDANTINSYALMDVTSNNNTTDLYFDWVVPAGFFANDLDVFDFVGFTTEVTAVDDGQTMANYFPQGADPNSLQSMNNLRVTRGMPKITNITSNAAASQNHPTNVIITVTFSEPVEVTDPTQVFMYLQNDLGGSQMNADASSMNAEATDNDNQIAFQINSITNFHAKDLGVASISGLSTYIRSVESGIYADSTFPQGPNSVGSLSYNKDIEINPLPKVVSVTRFDSNGNITTAGVDLDVMVTFNQNVTVTDLPRLVILHDDQVTPFYLEYFSGAPSPNLVFKGTTTAADVAGINTSDLTISSIDLGGGSGISMIRSDANQIEYSTALSFGETFPIGSDPRSLSSNENIVMGGKATITSIDFNGALDGVANAYTAGDVIEVYVRFSEAMSITAGNTANVKLVFSDDTPTDVFANYTSGSGTLNYVFQFTIPANMNTGDLELVRIDGLEFIEKTASPGSFVSTNVPKGDGSPNSLKSQADVVIGTAPVLTGSFIDTTTNASPFSVGQYLTVRANYDQSIAVDPAVADQVKLEFRDNDNNPVYAMLDTASLPTFQPFFFMYVPDNMNTLDLQVQAIHGIEHMVSAASKIPVDTNFPVLGAANSLSATYDFVVGGPAPTIVSMIDNASNGTFSSGQSVSMIVNFDIPVNIDSEDVSFVKLELTGDNANIAYATLNSFVSAGYQAYFDFIIPNQGFETADLTVTGFVGAEHVYNPASAISLDLTGAPFGSAVDGLQFNSAIIIQEIPKIDNFQVLSTPANGTYYQAPTDAGDELRIAVNFTKPVEVDTGNEGSPYIQIKNQDSTQFADGYIETASLSDGMPNQIIFTFNLPQTFSSNDIDIWSLFNFNFIEIPATATPVDFANYPTGSTAGSLMANSDVEVRNDVKVIGITSDVADGVHLDPSLHVRVQFNTPVTVQDIDLNDVFIRANGDNGTFAIANVDTGFAYQSTYELVFRFDFPDEFQTPEMMISFVGGFNMIVRPDFSAANIVDVPINGVPNSLAANKNIQIQQKDPMTVYGSGVDGDINLNESLDLSVRTDIIKDKDNQEKYPISFFRIRGIQYQTTPQPHHVITIQPGDAVNYRQFQQADGTPTTVTTLEQDDVVMWYVNSERGNACGNNLSPGMFGFLAADSFISATQARFGAPPGVDVSVMGGAFLPASGLPGNAPLADDGFLTTPSQEINALCNMQLVRVFMPRVLQLGSLATIMATYYNEYTGLGGILPIKVKEVLDLMGNNDADPTFDLTGAGFSSTDFIGFNGHSGWHTDLFTSVDQSGGLSQTTGLGGGGAGWRDGGNHSTSASSGGVSPETTYCAGNCYPGSDFNKMKYAFMGSAGASTPQDSVGGGVLVLHSKKIENGRLNVHNGGYTMFGGGSGGGSVYMDFEIVNQFGAAGSDVIFNVYANGSTGEYVAPGQESGGGGGGHINIQVCNNNNTTNASDAWDVQGGVPSDTASPGANGLFIDGLNSGTECLKTLPQ